MHTVPFFVYVQLRVPPLFLPLENPCMREKELFLTPPVLYAPCPSSKRNPFWQIPYLFHTFFSPLFLPDFE